ncbi:alpha/beta fold hydrolase [Thermodesulfobacteriota bacterium]
MKKKIIASIVFVFLAAAAVIYFAFPEVLFNISISSMRSSAGLSKGSLQVDDHKVVFLEGGKGDTILLVHGFTADKDNWTRFSQFLTPKYRVVAIDLPGFGESSKIESESYDIPAQVKRLDKIVTALGLESFHIAGNSMGGWIAGKYAVEYPQKVLSLGLLDTGGVVSCEKSEFRKLLDKGENPLLLDSVEDFEKNMTFVFEKPPAIPGSIKRYLAKQAIASKSFNAKVFNDIMKEGSLLESDLQKIVAKTLVIWGDKDKLIHVSCVDVLLKGIKDSKAAIIKNCGHLPMIERAEETAGHYLEFLKSIP